VFDYIQAYIAEHRHSPLIREIQTSCQITSYKSAIDRLSALEHKGFIRRVPNKHRGIKIMRRLLHNAPVPPATAAETAAVGQML